MGYHVPCRRGHYQYARRWCLWRGRIHIRVCSVHLSRPRVLRSLLLDPSRSSQLPVSLFLASSSIWEAVQTMTALDSATGRTLDHSFSMTASREPKAVSLVGGLSCRTRHSRLLELRLLLYVIIIVHKKFVAHEWYLDGRWRSEESSS
jgi:hypothetical protein